MSNQFEYQEESMSLYLKSIRYKDFMAKFVAEKEPGSIDQLLAMLNPADSLVSATKEQKESWFEDFKTFCLEEGLVVQDNFKELFQ